MDIQETTWILLKVRKHQYCKVQLANRSLVRTTRARIIHLRNDYKGLMSRIETGLHEHHASAKASNLLLPVKSSSPSTSRSGSTSAISAPLENPFAKVNSVVAKSPADDAGLMAGDTVRQFGNVTWINHEKLSKVAETVQRNEGVGYAFLIWIITRLMRDFIHSVVSS